MSDTADLTDRARTLGYHTFDQYMRQSRSLLRDLADEIDRLRSQRDRYKQLLDAGGTSHHIVEERDRYADFIAFLHARAVAQGLMPGAPITHEWLQQECEDERPELAAVLAGPEPQDVKP